MNKRITILAAVGLGAALLAGCLIDPRAGRDQVPTPVSQPPAATDVAGASAQEAQPPAGRNDAPAPAQAAGLRLPETYTGQYKQYAFAHSGGALFNERWFFQMKSGGAAADSVNFEGSACINPGETMSVIKTWGAQVGNAWLAFEGDPWMTVDGLPGRGVGAAASKLREAAALGGLDTAEMAGAPGAEKIVLDPVRNAVPGVDEKYWSALYSCDCEQQLDLWIVNPGQAKACVHWRVYKEEIVLWVEGQ